jgi:sugar transferase (PEP-CTERM system associated)
VKLIFRGLNWRTLVLIGCETVAIVCAVYLAALIRLGDSVPWTNYILPPALLFAVVTQLCLYFADLYDFRVITDRRELFVRSMQAIGSTSLILAGMYFWLNEWLNEVILGRGVFLIAAMFVVLFVLGWRISFDWAAHRVGPRDRLLLVGTSESAVKLARELYDRRDLGVEIVGFIDPDPARIGSPVFNPGVIGTIDDIPRIVRDYGIDEVVVSLSDARGKLPMDKLLEMKLEGVSFEHLASVYEKYTGKIAVENLRPSWLIFSPGFRKSVFLRVAKRALDVSASLAGLVLGAPLMLLVAAAVRLTSPGPVLYRQERVGLRGHIFRVIKFRSMRQDAEETTGAVWATKGDSRITAAGGFLRRTRLDELPQLWNVLKGDMSFVGPRPERPEFVTSLTKDIPFYGQRHSVRPGLTGWAQVRYTYGASLEDAMEKLQYDLFYIKNMSIALDLYIIVNTVKTVLMQRGGQ